MNDLPATDTAQLHILSSMKIVNGFSAVLSDNVASF